MPSAPANFLDWKHSLQNTGRPCVGLKGTVVSLPQAEHVVTVSTRSRVEAPPAGREPRLLLQALHRFGSFLKFLSAKNCCSPAVHTNSAPQSTHLRILSWNSIGRYLVRVVSRSGLVLTHFLPHPHHLGDSSAVGRLRVRTRRVGLAADATPARAEASFDSSSSPRPASLGACRRVSNRRSAS
jgi:hypothetical protein